MFRLIIAEDEQVQRDALVKLVKQWSPDAHIVGEVENGDEALTLMVSNSVDLVITDIKMPQSDGIELSRMLQRHYPATAIIIVSGYSEFQLAQSAIRYGVKRYVLKPVKKQELWQALSQVVQDRALTSNFGLPVLQKSRDQRIHYLLDFVHRNLDGEESLKEVCRLLGIVRYEDVRQAFQSELGQSFSHYWTRLKIIKAKEYLIKGNNVSETARLVGYEDVSNFVKKFKRETGETPGKWLKQRSL